MDKKYSEAFELYANLLCDLHALIAQNNDEGEEGDALRDRMDAPWHKFSEEEIELEGILSVDWYAVNSGGTIKIENEFNLGEIFAAIETDSLPESLKNLRKAEANLPQDMRAAIRGMIWSRFGFPYVAHCFYKKAAEWANRKQSEAGGSSELA
jgi:hypothetical protein